MNRIAARLAVLVLAAFVASGVQAEPPSPAPDAAGGAVPVKAVKPAPEPFKSVKKGDRVRVVLKTRAEFNGVARKATRDLLVIDLYLEERGLDGTMSFRADQVAKVEPLKRWDEKQLGERKADRDRRQREAEAELKRAAAAREAALKADEEAAKKSAGDAAAPVEGAAPDAKAAEEDLAKGIELLKAFPPADGWGTAPDKTVDWLRSRFTVIGVALSDSEKRFVDGYELWLKAKEAASKPAEEKPKEGGASGTPSGEKTAEKAP